ncbi:MAG TPA: carbamoyltransferase HypF [Myxococcaceae bacterium]|nr:carbamoyltransferase HypF [Myxococcaceae bacterium]
MHQGRRIEVVGTVQGVGFRPWVYRVATQLGIAGQVRNDVGGVTVEAFGEPEALDGLVQALQSDHPPAAEIRSLEWKEIPARETDGFIIAPSLPGTGRRVSIPADLATCPACVDEIFDPANRRYRYPFTNCTDCGPRFTIARDAPYDRPVTSMAGFVMCEACQREYDDPKDRRFHAQPNACPRCGPRLRLLDSGGKDLASPDPIREVTAALRAGNVVAVKGLGGYHLAVDATSSEAVRLLRERKRRDAKPFAVMARDLREARRLATISDAEARLLESVERPIVLVPGKRIGRPVAPEVAPDNPLLGLMLPYTPLHHLLLSEAERPLVMTSGNLSDEPIVFEEAEALKRLRDIADLFLTHDRPIVTRCDDSVARVVAGAPVLLRRSRGYVPRPIPLAHPVCRPVLACGAQLKNTFCLAAGDVAVLGPHVGDLDQLEVHRSYEESIDRMQRFLGCRPEVIAYDLHPDYASTRYAMDRPETVKVAVQHHHAHVASALAEHGLEGPVIGVVFDGTGYGTDGSSWGGEILVASAGAFQRCATLRPVALAGGERAIREPWRIGLALLLDAYDGDPPGFWNFPAIPEDAAVLVRQALTLGINAPKAHGMGRLFDGIGALVLGLGKARYEGEVALAWNLAADPGGHGRYPFGIDTRGAVLELDVRPMVRSLVEEHLVGVPAAPLAAKFHDTLAHATATLVGLVRERAGDFPVVLTGGCFQNARLAEGLKAALEPECTVYLHRQVPPGDGGIALGQVMVADATTRG